MSILHPPPWVALDLVRSLGERQELLGECLHRLLEEAWHLGLQVRIAEVKRDPRVAQLNAQSGAGIKNSLHVDSLAVDINLFRGNTYLSATVDHEPLGKFWEGLHPLCRWGGRFGDGNHYSITWQGRK